VALIAVVGGGLVGLSTAHHLQRTGRYDRVILLEKERDVAQHQSTHNSGVLHAGLYYKPGSQKARLAVKGLRQMTAFCREHGIAHEQCGKLVVAVDDDEAERLRGLLARGTENGLQGLAWLEGAEIREIEPHARGVAAVRVPEEGIADYGGVARTLRRLIEQDGGEVITGGAVTSMRFDRNTWTIRAGATTVTADKIVTCAGLHADRVAALAGEKPDVRIVPFRGEYYMLRPERQFLVRNLIYPVPNPAFPFLGVHFTRTVHGEIEAGPNAVLALSREGYRKGQIRFGDVADALTFPGLWRFMGRHAGFVAREIARSHSKALFLRTLQRLIPELRGADIVRNGSGVRAQAMTRDGRLVEDFELIVRENAVHVINAPSPAATASLAIGEMIAHLASSS
jgi:L-2-hydroxyglutarate oxidase